MKIREIVILILCVNNVLSDCRAVISELNGERPAAMQTSGMFIEIEFVCSNPSDIPHANGYKLLIVNGNQGKAPDVEMYANMIDFVTDEKRFFVVGQDDINPEPNMLLSNGKIFYRSKNMPKNQKTLFGTSTAATIPRAVILLKVTGREASTLDSKLRQINSHVVKIDEELKNIIKSNLQDMIVYGRKNSINRCSIFEDIYEPLKDMAYYMIREINPDGTLDSSLNRCSSSSKAFQCEHFKVGIPTPGKENDCSGSYMILEKEMSKRFPSKPSDVPRSSEIVESVDVNYPSTSKDRLRRKM